MKRLFGPFVLWGVFFLVAFLFLSPKDVLGANVPKPGYERLPLNSPPVIVTEKLPSARYGIYYYGPIEIVDPDGDAIYVSYKVLGHYPKGLTFKCAISSGKADCGFFGEPLRVGRYVITVFADDRKPGHKKTAKGFTLDVFPNLLQ